MSLAWGSSSGQDNSTTRPHGTTHAGRRMPSTLQHGSAMTCHSRKGGVAVQAQRLKATSPLVGGSRNGSLHSAASFTGSVRSEGSGGDSPRGSVVRVEDITILRLR